MKEIKTYYKELLEANGKILELEVDLIDSLTQTHDILGHILKYLEEAKLYVHHDDIFAFVKVRKGLKEKIDRKKKEINDD